MCVGECVCVCGLISSSGSVPCFVNSRIVEQFDLHSTGTVLFTVALIEGKLAISVKVVLSSLSPTHTHTTQTRTVTRAHTHTPTHTHTHPPTHTHTHSHTHNTTHTHTTSYSSPHELHAMRVVCSSSSSSSTKPSTKPSICIWFRFLLWNSWGRCMMPRTGV